MFKMQVVFQSKHYFMERHSVEKSMMQKISFFLLVLLVALEGCTQVPVTGGEPTTAGGVVIDSLAIEASDSFPPEYQLSVKGSLPTACHQLRTAVQKPTMQSEIHVQIYSMYDPYMVCAQVAKPFEASIPLGGYVRGSYTVFVNEKEVGEITP
jgi:hypothetical protein